MLYVMQNQKTYIWKTVHGWLATQTWNTEIKGETFAFSLASTLRMGDSSWGEIRANSTALSQVLLLLVVQLLESEKTWSNQRLSVGLDDFLKAPCNTNYSTTGSKENTISSPPTGEEPLDWRRNKGVLRTRNRQKTWELQKFSWKW